MNAQTVLMVLVRGGLMALGAFLTTYGIMQDSMVQSMIGAAPIIASVVLSLWDKWGRPIAEAQLEVWKLKAQANAAALHKANVPIPPAPTPAQVDAVTSSAVTPAVAAEAIKVTEALVRRV